MLLRNTVATVTRDRRYVQSIYVWKDTNHYQKPNALHSQPQKRPLVLVRFVLPYVVNYPVRSGFCAFVGVMAAGKIFGSAHVGGFSVVQFVFEVWWGYESDLLISLVIG
jgi:hypothetical protein